jgi:hypothetical protein
MFLTPFLQVIANDIPEIRGETIVLIQFFIIQYYGLSF